jgi:hypothetical protein
MPRFIGLEPCCIKGDRVLRKRTSKVGTRKNHRSSLKAKVAAKAIKSHKTTTQIVENPGRGWKKQALAGLPDAGRCGLRELANDVQNWS